jgi:drug/metabolite transporter (DMT)-like permease
MLVATRGRDLRPRPGSLGPLIFRGLVGAAAITLYFVGIAGVGAGLATLIQNTYPVFASILAALFLAERFSSRLGMALALNLAGVAIIVLAPGVGLAVHSVVGALSAAASAVLAGAAVTAVRHLRRREGASLITTYFMGVAAIATLPTLAWGLPAATPTLVAALVGVVLTSIAGQWLLHHGLGYATAAQGSLAAATNVLAATTLEAAVFGRTITPTMVAGAVLMFSAIALASTDRVREETES